MSERVMRVVGDSWSACVCAKCSMSENHTCCVWYAMRVVFCFQFYCVLICGRFLLRNSQVQMYMYMYMTAVKFSCTMYTV